MKITKEIAELHLLISDPELPHVPMQRDAEFLLTLKEPLLHCYSWSAPVLTYGYFARPDALLHLDQLARFGWHASRRPTGGGVIFHITDFAFSLLIPRAHPRVMRNPYANYAWINALVLKAIAPFFTPEMRLDLAPREAPDEEALQVANLRPTFCMAAISRYDLVVEGKKIGGAAERLTRDGLLHQGSLYLSDPPYEIIQDIVQNGKAVVNTMREVSRPLLGGAPSSDELQAIRSRLCHALYDTFSNALKQ